jgi:uncharacterized protein YktB (UPF0637 family)
MERLGFTRDDLAVFGVESREVREQTLNGRLRPRLEEIAYRFASPLSRLAGKPLVAVITLPQEASQRAQATASFVPEGGDATSTPYFTFVLTRGGVHARLIIERQHVGRELLAKRLTKAATTLARELGDADLRCYDEWDGRGVPSPSVEKRAPFWRQLAARLVGEPGKLDIGLGWPEARAVLLSYEDLLPAYRNLVPLYKHVSNG